MEETVTLNLELNVEQTMSELRKVELLAYRSLGLLKRLGLPEDIEQGIEKLQRLIMTIRLAHTAIMAFQAVLLAGTPIGWGLAIVAGASAAFSAGDFVTSLGG